MSVVSMDIDLDHSKISQEQERQSQDKPKEFKPGRLPHNPFNRMHRPTKCGAVLISCSEGEVVCEDFSEKTDFYRPVLFSPINNKKINNKKRKTDDPNLSSPTQNKRKTEDPNLSSAMREDKKGQDEKQRADAPRTQTTQQESPLSSAQRLLQNGKTPNGSRVSNGRSIPININGKKRVILLFSPDRPPLAGIEAHRQNPPKNLNRKVSSHVSLDFSDIPMGNNSDDETPRQLKRINSNTQTKGGEAVVIQKEKHDRKQYPKQDTTMEKTAKQAILGTLKKNEKKYSKSELLFLESLVKNFPLEWLHGLAFSLTPLNMNPQSPQNLGSAGKWINTLMMVLETVARHFSVKHPRAVSVKPLFIMLDDSDVISEIHYEVTIKKKGVNITLQQSIQALELPNRRNWPSCSDSAQIIHIVEALLEGSKPRSSVRFKM